MNANEQVQNNEKKQNRPKMNPYYSTGLKHQTYEQYLDEARKTLLPEFKEVFESTNSSNIKRILNEASISKPEYRFTISLFDFEKLNEEEFKTLKQFTNEIKIRYCDPGKLLLAILKKKEFEHYSINFTITNQTVQDIFSNPWDVTDYTLTF